MHTPRTPHHRSRRRVPTLLGALLLGALAVGGPPPASASTTTPSTTTAMTGATGSPAQEWSDPAAAAGRYLAGQLAAGTDVLSTSYEGKDYPDYGLTADAVLGLDAAGTAQDQAAASTSALRRHAVDYVGGGAKGDHYAGATAKLLLVALAQGEDPSAFGGYDLPAVLASLEAGSGRYRDDASAGDFSNVVGQSLAVIALSRTDHPASPEAVSFLLDQQCDDGGFRLDPGTKPCTSDPDTTAVAAQAALAAGTDAATAAARRAVDQLASAQTDAGGVAGTGPTAGVNANSTGLAGQAFAAAGRDAASSRATDYLVGLQYGCHAPTARAGAVPYDAAAARKGRSARAEAATSDEDRRATAQAVLALAGTPLASVSADGAAAAPADLTCATAAAGTAASGASGSAASGSAASDARASDDPGTASSWWTSPLAIGVAVAVVALLLAGVLLARAGSRGRRTT